MMFQDTKVEIQDRVDALETSVDDAVEHGLPQECAKVLRDIVFRTHLDVFRRAFLGDPPARVQPRTVRLRSDARTVWAKPRVCPIVHIAGDANCWGDLLSGWVTRSRGPVCAHASVNYAEVLFAGSDKFPPKEVVRDVQAAVAEGGPTGDTTLGVASLDCGGLYRVDHHGHHVICSPAGADTQKK